MVYTYILHDNTVSIRYNEWNFQHALRNPENVRREHTIRRNYYLLRIVISASECKYKSKNSKNHAETHIVSGKLTKPRKGTRQIYGKMERKTEREVSYKVCPETDSRKFV